LIAVTGVHVAPLSVERDTRTSLPGPFQATSQLPARSVTICGVTSMPLSIAALLWSAAGELKTLRHRPVGRPEAREEHQPQGQDDRRRHDMPHCRADGPVK